MSEYHQPVFYRFNEDSLLLVREVAAVRTTAKNLLDIGAGSGVIGIELANKLGVQNVHFLELQRDWGPVLERNVAEFLPGRETQIFWDSVSRWKPGMKYDLIVSNPPYYLPGNGQLSPDPVRAKCRSFLEDDWKTLGEKIVVALAPGGSAYVVTLTENLPHVREEWELIPFVVIERNHLVILRIGP